MLHLLAGQLCKSVCQHGGLAALWHCLACQLARSSGPGACLCVPAFKVWLPACILGPLAFQVWLQCIADRACQPFPLARAQTGKPVVPTIMVSLKQFHGLWCLHFLRVTGVEVYDTALSGSQCNLTYILKWGMRSSRPTEEILALDDMGGFPW